MTVFIICNRWVWSCFSVALTAPRLAVAHLRQSDWSESDKPVLTLVRQNHKKNDAELKVNSLLRKNELLDFSFNCIVVLIMLRRSGRLIIHMYSLILYTFQKVSKISFPIFHIMKAFSRLTGIGISYSWAF